MNEIFYAERQPRAEFCHPVKEQQILRLLELVNGVPRAATWKPFEMELIRRDGRKALVEVSSPWIGPSALIFRKRALGDLEPFLLSYGELLPLSCPEAELVIFNATRLIGGREALDMEKSEFWQVPSGPLLRRRKCVFRVGGVTGVDVFKLRGVGRESSIFLSRQAVDRFTASGITGLDYVKTQEG